MRLLTKIKTIFSILLVIIAFAGCDEKVSSNLPDPELGYLYVLDLENNVCKAIELDAMDGDYSISIVSSYPSDEVKIASSVPWLTCNKSDDSNYTIKADFNNSVNDRVGGIQISSSGRSLKLDVKQRGLVIDPENDFYAVDSKGNRCKTIEFGSTESDYTFSIVSSIPSIAVKIDSSVSWLICQKSGDSNYMISAKFNNSVKDRNGTINITPDIDSYGCSHTLNVIQSGRTVTVYQNNTIIDSGNNITFASEGGTSLTYNINADGEYSLSKDSKDSWYSITHDQLTDSFSVTTSTNQTNYIREGKITISLVGLPSGESLNKDIIVRQSGAPNEVSEGHEFVDLGLPSGLKWATCNVGASSLEEYGDYFACGETKTKNDYSDINSLTYGKTDSELRSMGVIDSSGNLTSSYDAASANWGGNWRMPTEAECEELKYKCTWTWTTLNGKNGFQVTGPNGNSIFLPAAGYRNGTSLNYAGWEGHYLSSTVYTYGAYQLYFSNNGHGVSWLARSFGRSVRPVIE